MVEELEEVVSAKKKKDMNIYYIADGNAKLHVKFQRRFTHFRVQVL